jgi:hypothetical protein
MAIQMLTWWYGTGLILAFRRISTWVQKVEQLFSAFILLRTLFKPWKRIVTLPGKSLDAHIHAAVDNLVSRCIGFLIRLLVLITAAVMLVTTLILGVAQFILWLVLPLSVILFIVKGVMV